MEHDNKTVDSEGFILVKYFWQPKYSFTGKVKFPNGDIWWYKNGMRHREDGPAIERADGSVEWRYAGVEGLENFPPELKKKLTRKFIHEA